MTRSTRAAFIVWICVMVAVPAHASAPTSYETTTTHGAWTEARALYDAGRYTDALRAIDAALVTAPDDLDLLWLKAATLDRADRADEALALYEHIARMYPEEASRLNTDYANALARAGRLSEAASIFRSVLEEDPHNAEALRGFARVLNWQGHHRAAAEMFRTLERANGTNPEVDGGLAWADYWSGRPDRARADVARVRAVRPHDPSMRRLTRILDREVGSGPTVGVSVTSDNDGLDITTFTARQRVASGHGRTLFHIGVREDDVTREGIEFQLWRAGAGIEHVWTAALSTHTFVDVLGNGPAGVHRVFGNAWATITPTERIRFDVAGASDQVLTIGALGEDVRVTTAAASVDWRVTNRLSLGGRGARFSYTDDNTQMRLTGETRLRVIGSTAHGISLTADAATLSSDRTPGTGYYSPEQYDEMAGGLLLTYEPWTAFVITAHGRAGVLREDAQDTQSFGTYIVRGDGMLLPHVVLSTGVSGGDSNLSSPSGYSRTSVWVEGGFRF